MILMILDKDGTLFAYSETWNKWCSEIIEELSEGHVRLVRKLAKAIEFDLESGKVYHKVS